MPGSRCHRPKYWWPMRLFLVLLPFVVVVAVVEAVAFVSSLYTFLSTDGAPSFHIFLALLSSVPLCSLCFVCRCLWLLCKIKTRYSENTVIEGVLLSSEVSTVLYLIINLSSYIHSTHEEKNLDDEDD